jgi:ABC-type glycerol-3-phosphate transport system permease component
MNRIGLKSSLFKRTIFLLLILAIVVVCIFPIYWMVTSAFRTYANLTTDSPSLFPKPLSLQYIQTVLKYTPFFMYLKNSLVVCIGTVLINLIIGSMAAHSLARMRFRGKAILARGILLAYVFPKMVIIVPLFVVIAKLHILNTYIGLILTYVVFTFPFSVWMLTAYFKKIPKELEECAHIDGASNLRTYVQIVLPLSAPGLAASAIFTFVATWKEFLYAFLLLNAENRRTLTVGLYGFIGAEVMEWGETLAFSTLMVVPVIIFFLFVQRSFIQGLTAGAVKG